MNNDIKAVIPQKTLAEIGVFAGQDRKTIEQGIKKFKACANAGQKESEVCRLSNSKKDFGGICRAFVVFKDWDDFFEQTSEENLKYVDYSENVVLGGKSVFLFPGNGIHQKKMLNLLCSVNSYFNERLRELNNTAKKYYDIALLDEEQENDVIKQLRVFASELVIAEFWEKCGCKADYIIGHSMGEYAAACFAGVLKPDDAIHLLVARGSILQKCNTHRMAAVETSAQNVLEKAVSRGLSVEISAFNAPGLVTVSGEKDTMELLARVFKGEGVQFNLINTNYGGHFSGLKVYTEEFIKKTGTVEFYQPIKEILSTVYPELSSSVMTTPEYWAEHIYKPVKFQQAIEKLPIAQIGRIIDVGVSPVLLGMAMRNIPNVDISWIPTVRAGRNYRQQVYRALGLAFNSGVDVEWGMLE